MIIVFARAPVVGRAKTRLIPALGAWRAARLHERLIRHAVRTAQETREVVELHGTRGHSFFRRLNVRFRLQRGRDLGERMQHALSHAPKPAILIGSDCPSLTSMDLERALRSLQGGCDVVLAPAEDGGYALIGARRSPRRLFEGMPWSTPQVYAQTVKRLAGCRWRALRRVWDVDRPEDLARLRMLRLASAKRRAAPRSRGNRARSGGSGRP